MKTLDNYYRVILETVHGYSEEVLNTMTDDECDEEYSVLSFQRTEGVKGE